MSEGDAVERVDQPVTADRIEADLRALGLAAGETALVHSSLGSLGWVPGGPQAVVDALQSVVTESGTLVMPTHTTQYSDPTHWSDPPVPDDWVAVIAESMPPYRPAVTPSRGMGAIPECFRTYPRTIRSRHPEFSFAAWGSGAESVVADHGFDDPLGEDSPLATVYERGGKVLLLGVGHDANTSLHLAEHRAAYPKERRTHRAPILDDGQRVTVEYEGLVTSTEDFPDAGRAVEERVGVREGAVGAADATLVDQPALVDVATEYFERTRSGE